MPVALGLRWSALDGIGLSTCEGKADMVVYALPFFAKRCCQEMKVVKSSSYLSLCGACRNLLLRQAARFARIMSIGLFPCFARQLHPVQNNLAKCAS